MKKVIKIFLAFHFSIIIISSCFLFLDSYLSFRHKTKIENPIITQSLNYFLYNPIVDSYRMLSGINTGYGFYGINVATEKFFVVDLLDEKCNKIKESTTFGLKKKNSLSRFQVLSSSIFNRISDNRQMKEDLECKKEAFAESQIKFNDKYIKKIFKYVGRAAIKEAPNCSYYNVKLLALNPKEIWKNKNYDEKTSAFIYKQMEFRNQN